jgi:hypothetical protein
LQALHADILRLLVSAYPDASDAMVNDFGKDVFIRALERKLRDKIQDRGPRNMDDALRMALEYEVHERSPSMDRDEPVKRTAKGSSIKEKSSTRVVVSGTTSSESALTEIKDALNALQEDYKSICNDYKALRRDSQKTQSARNDFQQGLGQSKQTGLDNERWSDCQDQEFGKSQQPQPYGKQFPVSKRKCWGCGRIGHIRAECPDQLRDQ